MNQLIERHEINKVLLLPAGDGVLRMVGNSGVMIKGSRTFSNGKEEFKGDLCMYGDVDEDNKQSVMAYYENVVLPIPKQFPLRNMLSAEVSLDLKVGTECATCKKPLQKGVAHYICVTCTAEGKKDYAFCLECADEELTQEINFGSELFHPHGLLRLYEDSEDTLESVLRYMTRTIIIPDDDPRLPQLKAKKLCEGIYDNRTPCPDYIRIIEFFCDVCGTDKTITHYRWACAHCKDFDVCTDCMKASRDPSHKRHREVMAISVDKGHNMSHLLYRSHYLMNIGRCVPEFITLPKNE